VTLSLYHCTSETTSCGEVFTAVESKTALQRDKNFNYTLFLCTESINQEHRCQGYLMVKWMGCVVGISLWWRKEIILASYFSLYRNLSRSSWKTRTFFCDNYYDFWLWDSKCQALWKKKRKKRKEDQRSLYNLLVQAYLFDYRWMNIKVTQKKWE